MSPVFVFIKLSSPYAFLVHWGVLNYIRLHIFFLPNADLYPFAYNFQIFTLVYTFSGAYIRCKTFFKLFSLFT